MREFRLDSEPIELLNLLEFSKHEPVVFIKNGEPLSVLVSFKQFEEFLEAIEELEDITLAEESLRDTSSNLSWKEVKEELEVDLE